MPKLALFGAPVVVQSSTAELFTFKRKDGVEITLDADQTRAVNGIFHEKFSNLIGPAGCGKTLTTRVLIERLVNVIPLMSHDGKRVNKQDEAHLEPGRYAKAVCLCSFTGRAVQQLKRNLPPEWHPYCMTVHKMLGYMPFEEPYFDEESGEYRTKLVFRPSFTKDNKLPFGLIIIDEASMLPIHLWNEINDAMLPDCRVIMVGDINQLPPVMGRSVFGYALNEWPTFELTTIHRQALDNPIIANAHRVLNGKIPERDPLHFMIANGSQLPPGSLGMGNIVVNTIKQLSGKDLFDPLKDALIVPQNKGNIGQTMLNERLVMFFNPKGERTQIHTGRQTVIFGVGDKVMITKNMNERGLTNGMMGTIEEITENEKYNFNKAPAHLRNAHLALDVTEIDLTKLNEELGGPTDEEVNQNISAALDEDNQNQSSHTLFIRFFEQPDILYSFSSSGDLASIQHAYAMTCHKMQGSEARNVVIVVHQANSIMLNREWLYTAITRAQERIILLATDQGLINCLSKQKIKGQTTAEKIASFEAWLMEGKKELENNGRDEDNHYTVPEIPKAMKV